MTHLELSGTMTASAFEQLQRNPTWGSKLKKLRLRDQTFHKPFMSGMREFSKARPSLAIEMVKTGQIKKDGWWQLDVSHKTYKKGRKQ
jgi:hypothetical protein